MYVRDDKGETVKTIREWVKNSPNPNQQKIPDNSAIYQPENTRYENKNFLFHIKRCSDLITRCAEAYGKGGAGECVWKGPGEHTVKNPWHLLS